jgi:NAD(P)-dependent dehydrogenase (short-subunit alcohol dehydrogenase family)
MTVKLKDRVAITTGAGQGIGEATAKRMAAEGARVVVSDINEETGQAVVQAIRDQGGEATFVRADVSNVDDVKALIAAAKDTYGRLDVLHNNAGVHETNFTAEAQSTELTEEIWDKVIDINLKGTWMCSKYAAPLLAEAGGGAIVNAASIGGLVGYPMGAV